LLASEDLAHAVKPARGLVKEARLASHVCV
jgi:hypothetical protein